MFYSLLFLTEKALLKIHKKTPDFLHAINDSTKLIGKDVTKKPTVYRHVRKLQPLYLLQRSIYKKNCRHLLNVSHPHPPTCWTPVHIIFTCPRIGGQSLAEMDFCSIPMTSGSMLRISAYPPRTPHSPMYPYKYTIRGYLRIINGFII